jgi:hypothetical protein
VRWPPRAPSWRRLALPPQVMTDASGAALTSSISATLLPLFSPDSLLAPCVRGEGSPPSNFSLLHAYTAEEEEEEEEPMVTTRSTSLAGLQAGTVTASYLVSAFQFADLLRPPLRPVCSVSNFFSAFLLEARLLQ